MNLGFPNNLSDFYGVWLTGMARKCDPNNKTSHFETQKWEANLSLYFNKLFFMKETHDQKWDVMLLKQDKILNI